MKLVPLMVFASFAGLAVSPANAQNQSPDPSPPEMISVVGTRSASKLFEVPYTVHRIDANTYLANAYRTTPQAFRDIPGVMVQETSMGQGSPYIRGFTGFRNLFLVDGVRLNNSTFREGPNQYWATVDGFSLQALEVLNGAASTLYGTDAVGGTVNALTIDPEGTHTRLMARGSTAENSAIASLEQSLELNSTTGIWAGVSIKSFGDLEGGRDLGLQSNVGYDEESYGLKLVKRLGDTVKLTLLHQQLQQDDVPRTHTTSSAKSWEGTSIGTDLQRSYDQRRTLSYLMYDHDGPFAGVDHLKLTLSSQNADESLQRIRSNRRVEWQDVDVDTQGLSLQLESTSAFGRWTYGVDYYRDTVDSFATGNNVQGPVADDAGYEMVDLFVQNLYELGAQTQLTTGIRSTNVSLDADKILDPDRRTAYSASADWDQVIGNIRISHQLVPGSLIVFAGTSQSFRTPNLSDYTRFDSARTNEFEIPSIGLTPEKYLAFESGLKWRGNLGEFEAAVFRTRISDMIIRVPTGRIRDGNFEITKKNVGDGHVQGIEARTRIALSSAMFLKGMLSWLDSSVNSYPTSQPVLVKEPLERLMPFTWHTSLEWRPQTSPLGLWGEVSVEHANQQDELSSRDRNDTSRIPPGGTPAFTVLNLYSGIEMGDYRVYLALENLLDEDYRIHGSGTNRPGRNAVLTISANW